MKKSWAHEDLPANTIKKYAATLTEEEIREVVEADIQYGLTPVIVGDNLEDCRRFGIMDIEAMQCFSIMGEMNDDSVWSYAVTKYVFEHGFQRFESLEKLQAHVAQLTEAKYGKPAAD